MNNFIYSNPNKNVSKIKNDEYYTIIENYDFIDEKNNPRVSMENDPRVYAKIKYKSDGKTKFLIKLDNNRKLYNPTSQLLENKQNKLLEQYKLDSSSFKEVSEKVFDYYLTFLKTSNPSWINNAEREDF